MKKDKKILLVGGGTGGHAGPIAAIYWELKKQSPDFSFCVVGTGTPEEKPFFEGIDELKTIESGKLHLYLTLKNLVESRRFIRGFFQSIQLLKAEAPDLIFSKGGFVSLPVVLAAKCLKIPYYLHESDIVMGKVNRLMAKGAKKVFVSYPLNFYPFLQARKMIWTGQIMRSFTTGQDNSGLKYFGFNNTKPVIFLTGGSQGSTHMSENFIKIAKKLLEKYNIIHQAGKHSIEISQEFYKSLSPTERNDYFLTAFLGIEKGVDMMAEAIKAASLVITRSGSTIIEMAEMAKPMILIPWKNAASNHQEENAKYLTDRAAAVMITDDELSPERLLSEIESLLSNQAKLKELGESARKLFPRDARLKICEILIKELSK
jgi:UDP-N-acetylglucosamine--N-acetylmuramyl-(pentapeptide) pyrophosphoryl-undecaprenol N-acetylglucosamine transferase